MIQLCLQRAGLDGKIVAYVLPTYQLRNRFVQNRVDPLLQQIPEYRSLLRDGNLGNVSAKRFGKGSMLFLGSNTPNDFIEFSADTLIVDEFDRCVSENLALARDRVRASPDPQIFRIGNPTLPRVGIADLYEKGDQRRYFHRCTHCNTLQALDWIGSFVERSDSGLWVAFDTKRYDEKSKFVRARCKKCHRLFDRTGNGQWVAKKSETHKRSYTMSRLDCLDQSIYNLVIEWNEAQDNTTRLVAFYNSVLGVPYEHEGSSVTIQMLSDLARAPEMDYGGGLDYGVQPVVAGVDVGKILHVTISVIEKHNGEQVRVGRWIGTCRTFEQLGEMLKRYCVDILVIDSRPETRKAQELRDRCLEDGSCQVYLCQFHPTDRVGREAYGFRIDYTRCLITVDRTQILDATLDDMRSSPPRRLFPSDVFTVPGFADEMQAPKRILHSKGDRFLWTKGPDDHFRFADAYERIAADLFGNAGGYSVVET